MHQVKKLVINWFRLVKTETGLDQSKTAKNWSWVVQSGFLTYWDFGGLVSVSVHVPERQKPDWTGLDFQALTIILIYIKISSFFSLCMLADILSDTRHMLKHQATQHNQLWNRSNLKWNLLCFLSKTWNQLTMITSMLPWRRHMQMKIVMVMPHPFPQRAMI
jgi:hypothetical protein